MQSQSRILKQRKRGLITAMEAIIMSARREVIAG